MTLQTTGPISLYQIQTEFGGSAPIALSEYYRGGSYVPSDVSAIPSFGGISIAHFYGTSLGPPIVTSLILTASVNNASHIVTFYAQVNVSRINDTGAALSFTLNLENSTDGVNFYYFGTQTTVTVPTGQNYGSITVQMAQTGSTAAPLTQYSRSRYNTIISNTTSGWQETYQVALEPSVISVGVYDPPAGPGTVMFFFTIYTNYVNQTGSTQYYGLTIYNNDSPDLLGDSGIAIAVPNGASYGTTTHTFDRVNAGFVHMVSSYAGYGGLTSNGIGWTASY